MIDVTKDQLFAWNKYVKVVNHGLIVLNRSNNS